MDPVLIDSVVKLKAVYNGSPIDSVVKALYNGFCSHGFSS
jgi:hypothetical protein